MTTELQREDWELGEGDRVLVGLWIDLGSRMEKDGTWQRILWLIRERLEEVAVSAQADSTLYRNPAGGAYWELVKTRPDLPEGGPPMLRRIEKERIAEIYSLGV